MQNKYWYLIVGIIAGIVVCTTGALSTMRDRIGV
jgi:hypothetical protein